MLNLRDQYTYIEFKPIFSDSEKENAFCGMSHRQPQLTRVAGIFLGALVSACV